MQRTFGETVGMEPVVPVSKHVTDMVTCSDDSECSIFDALEDCEGGYHSSTEDRHEADVELVTKILDGQDEWVSDYVENGDYVDGYFCILKEGHHDYKEALESWVAERFDTHNDIIEDAYESGELDTSEYDKIKEDGEGDDTIDQDWNLRDYINNKHFHLKFDDVVSAIHKNLNLEFDCEPFFDSNEYGSYSGPGVYITGFDVGEYEDQLDISCCESLQELHDQGRLDDVLDNYNGDSYVSRSKKRVKNEKTGRYEEVGRETYGSDEDHPCIMTYHNPGGRWDFVIMEERLEELYQEALVQLCE